MPDAPKSGGLIKDGKIGGIKKEYVYAGVGIAGIVFIAVYYRSKSQAASGAATVTDPAGNVCAALSPTSGYCPGTPQDLAYEGTGVDSTGGTVGADSSSFVGGQIIGYDQFGNPIYSSSGQQTTGPGAFTNNAAWSQAALTTLTDNDPNSNPGTISAALGVYINGEPATPAQVSIIQQAIAFEGSPPVGGTDGYPPSIRDAGTGGTGTTTTKITVPNVVKDTVNAAEAKLQSAGLTFNNDPTKDKAGYERIVTAQKPAANTKAEKGTKVSLTWSFVKQKPPKMHPGGK
jgi:hypothetical protein